MERAKWGSGAVLAAVLSVLAVYVGAGADVGGDGAGNASGTKRSAAGPASAGVPPPRIPSSTQLPGRPYGIGFATDGGGFALLAQCSEQRCRQRVAVLDRGADTWRLGRSPLSDVTGDQGMTGGLMTLGSGRALITEGRWPLPERTWFTRDGGHTWQRGSTEPSGTTTAVPGGGALIDECVELDREEQSCGRSRLLAVLPASGEFRVLKTQPPLEGVVRPAGEIVLTRSGSGLPAGVSAFAVRGPEPLAGERALPKSEPLWPPGQPAGNLFFASGADPESGMAVLAVSENRGRTWRTARLPGADKAGWGLRVVASGSVLYAAQPGPLPEDDTVKNGLQTIHRSTDGGHTWERTWKHRKGAEPRSLIGDLLAAADGSLTVYGEDGVWRSADGGRTFERARGTQGYAGSVTVTALGYLRGEGGYRISADGIHWHSFDLGGGS